MIELYTLKGELFVNYISIQKYGKNSMALLFWYYMNYYTSFVSLV